MFFFNNYFLFVQIKVEHKKSSVEKIVKKKLSSSSFLNFTTDYYNKDLLEFFEEKESARRRILFDHRRLNLSEAQRDILVKHLINVNVSKLVRIMII